MAKSLPKDSAKEIRTPYEAIALLCHSSMLAVGFRLVGLGEDHKLGTLIFDGVSTRALQTVLQSELSLTSTSIETTAEQASPQPLPSAWAGNSPSFAFRYSHDQSSLEYLLKVSRLGSKAIINGLAIDDDKVHSLDILIRDFLSESSFPLNMPESTGPNEVALAIRQIFISPGRLTDAGSLIKLQIIQKLAPGLRKEGYEDSAHAASHNVSQTQASDRRRRDPEPEAPPRHDPLRDDPIHPAPARPYPFDDPLAAGPPRRPFPAGEFVPPDFEDEHQMIRPPFRGGLPPNIGEGDLYPQGLGPHDPLRGGIGPRFGGGGMPGGMHMIHSKFPNSDPDCGCRVSLSG